MEEEDLGLFLQQENPIYSIALKKHLQAKTKQKSHLALSMHQSRKGIRAFFELSNIVKCNKANGNENVIETD